MMTSFPFNLCGHGFLTGPWKGDPSLHVKTLIAAGGPIGVTMFFITGPSKWGSFPEECAGISEIPTTSSSFNMFMATTDKIVFQSYLAQIAGDPLYTITVDDDDAGLPMILHSFIVCIFATIICVLCFFLAALTLRNLPKVISFAGAILLYEGIASIVRATIYIMFQPPNGPYFYTGVDFVTDQYVLSPITKPLGVPTNVMTSLLWLKFTLFRSEPPVAVDITMVLLSVLATVLSFWATLQYPTTFISNGILQAGITAQTTESKELQLRWNITLQGITTFIFLLANGLWLAKLSTMAKTSPALAEVAKKCLMIMCVQLLLIFVLIFFDAASLDNADVLLDPFCDEEGKTKYSIFKVGFMIEPIPESLVGLSQVWAVRTLSTSSSSSSSSYTTTTATTNPTAAPTQRPNSKSTKAT